MLRRDPSNVEALACLAATHFYEDQAEVALTYFRRLLQMGRPELAKSAELWNNLGLACFGGGQYDMVLTCFDRALRIAEASSDYPSSATATTAADIWFNISYVAISIGDLSLASQALRIATAVDPAHAEAHNSLGVLALQKGNKAAAKTAFATACKSGPWLYEPHFNIALLAFEEGNVAEAFEFTSRALQLFPGHLGSQELQKRIQAALEAR